MGSQSLEAKSEIRRHDLTVQFLISR